MNPDDNNPVSGAQPPVPPQPPQDAAAPAGPAMPADNNLGTSDAGQPMGAVDMFAMGQSGAPAAPAPVSADITSLEGDDASQPMGAVDMSAMGQSGAPAAPAPDATQNAANPNMASETPAEAPAQEEFTPPIQPAAPAPGSIGSAASGPEITVNIEAPAAPAPAVAPDPAVAPAPAPNPAPNPQQPPVDIPATPVVPPADPFAKSKKKSHTTTIVLIIILVLALAGVAFAFFGLPMLEKSNTKSNNQNQSQNNQPSDNSAEKVSETKNLRCDLDNDESLLKTFKDSTTVDDYVLFNYKDDVLADFNSSTTITYASEDVAKAKVSEIEKYYKNALSLAGLKEDPFKTTVSALGSTVEIVHSGKAADLDEKSSSLFYISLDEDKKPMLGLSDIRKKYESEKYICTLGSTKDNKSDKK